MLKDFFRARQTQYAAYATVYIAVVIGVLGLVNFLANRYNWSYDSTTNKRYSLSEQTEKIVKNLKKDVTITYFDRTRGFPVAKDLLSRYENLSGKLKIAYVDHEKDPMKARSAGIRSVPTTLVEAGLKRDEAKSLTEEELTGALIRVLKDGERNVCFVTGLGEHSPDETSGTGMSGAKELAEKSNYKVRSISLLEKPEIPKDCTVVVVGGPRKDYPEALASTLKLYVETGGKAMFLVDPPLQGLRDDISSNPELWKVLNTWGVKSSDEVVLDTSGAGRMFRMGPEIPLVASYEAHPIVRDLKETASAMPLARPLEAGGTVGKASTEKLFSSMANSYAKSVNGLKGEIAIDPAKDKKGPFVLGIAGTFNTGQPNNNGRFVVIGSSSFAINAYMNFGGNRDLFGNALNWLAADEDLISIRPKDPEDRRIQVTNRQMSLLFWSTILLIPLAVIAAGVSVWLRRR
jgi:ABC-type uncharacterized transport system involved in gliding motility auxiliary subunit